jgi:hypothetical protein
MMSKGQISVGSQQRKRDKAYVGVVHVGVLGEGVLEGNQ